MVNLKGPNTATFLMPLLELSFGTTQKKISAGRELICINRLFAYCKGGNFNIHIWAWFGYFIS